MAYGKQIFISDTDEHDLAALHGTDFEYCEVAEDGTTFETYTPGANTYLYEGAGAGNKLASTTDTERFSFGKGARIPIPCEVVKLATGAAFFILRVEE